MPILNIKFETPGEGGVSPRIVYILTNDTIAQILTPGYLSKTSFLFSETDMALVVTKTTPLTTSAQVGFFNFSFLNNLWSLVPASSISSTPDHIVTYLDTIGTLSEDPVLALTGGALQAWGNIIAGKNGTAGSFISYSPSTSKGNLISKASDNSGDFIITITNNAHGQTTTYTLSDVGTTTASILNTVIPNADIAPNFVTFNQAVTAATLSAGATIVLGGTAGGGHIYRLRNLWLNKGTNFSGGGGDRNILIMDSTISNQLSLIPAAGLTTLVNLAWGATNLPYPPTSINTPTTAGSTLIAKYSGGGFDYSTGNTTISGILERVT